MKQREITSPVPLLKKNGGLTTTGYARHLFFEYDQRAIKACPLALKEWDFYQISDHDKVIQLTIGHISYMASVSVNLFKLESGKRHSSAVMQLFPLRSMGMETDPERPHQLKYEKPNFKMVFDVAENDRHLTLSAMDPKEGSIEVDLHLSNCGAEKEKMVIATPFTDPHQFYLNYKENCYLAKGRARFGKNEFFFSDGAYGLLDWGRGVWPFTQEWIWGNGSTLLNGIPFGFNIGWGFGDTSAATENMFFYDNKTYKLGKVSEDILKGKGYSATKRYHDEEGLFDLTAEPVYDNYTTTKILFVDNSCHQVFSRWHGRVVIDGKIIEIPEMTAFCEHAKNRW